MRQPSRFLPSGILAALLLGGVAQGQVQFAPPEKLPPNMKQLEGRYHVLYHDLTEDESHEAILRMDAMTEEYLQRTRGFSGRLMGKMPFVLFRDRGDYHAAGGIPGSDGVFTGTCLMAVAGEKLSTDDWHVIQHEGFHEFAAAVINPRMPIWVNEGLAEYFGEAIFTGDGFVSGLIPHGRMRRIQESMRNGQFSSVHAIMRLSHTAWNRRLNVTNYDQAWAMTQFLAHGDDGKYQRAFSEFMNQIGRGVHWQTAWNNSFGSAEGFEEKWQAWWLSLTDDTPLPGYAQVATQMLTSYLARATSQKQTFTSIDELVTAIREKNVIWHKQDPLPATLADECNQLYTAITRAGGKFDFVQVGTGPAARTTGVSCELKDGTRITATFKLNGQRVRSVESKVEKPKASTTRKREPARR